MRNGWDNVVVMVVNAINVLTFILPKMLCHCFSFHSHVVLLLEGTKPLCGLKASRRLYFYDDSMILIRYIIYQTII
jgi:hypothetical protein